MMVLRPVCAALGLVPSMERCGYPVEPQNILGLLAVRFDLCFNMRFDYQAELDARAMVALAPSSSISHLCLGNVYARNAQAEKARKAYVQALQIDPENPDVVTRMSELGAMQRMEYLSGWMTRISTIKRVLVIAVVVVFVVLFIVQGLQIF